MTFSPILHIFTHVIPSVVEGPAVIRPPDRSISSAVERAQPRTISLPLDIANRVKNSRRSECGRTRSDRGTLVTHLNLRLAFENNVEFILAGVRMRGMLLSRLETIQSGEKGFAVNDIHLAHFLGRELGEIGEAFDDHRG